KKPTIQNVLGFLDITTGGAELEDVDGSFDDANCVITARWHHRGWAVRRDGHWSRNLGTFKESKLAIVRQAKENLLLESRDEDAVQSMVIQIKIVLPHGASEITMDSNNLSYTCPAHQGVSEGRKSPSWRVDAQPHIMAALYKLY